MSLRILCISLRTPPTTRPQAILIGKMIPEWIRHGMNPMIVTYDSNGTWDIDVPLYTIPVPQSLHLVKHIPFARLLPRYKYCRHIVRTVLEPIISRHRINAIFSFSNPQISNIIGTMAHRRYGIKFIAHFSDPWYDNPFYHLSPLTAKEILWQERFIISNSDRVIFVAEQARDIVMRKYPLEWRKKTRIIPHCFNERDYPDVRKEPHDQYLISHIGAFNAIRNPEPLLVALNMLVQRYPYLRNRFRLQLIGATDSYLEYSASRLASIIEKYNLKNQVEVLPTVMYKDSLRYMKLADCCIVIDADILNSPFLPSKVVDYAGSSTPVIGITPAGSPTTHFLQQLGYRSFTYHQLSELADHLADLISGRHQERPNRMFLEQFSVSHTTMMLKNEFLNILKT